MKENLLKFTQLARYSPTIVADSRARMSRSVSGVSDDVIKQCRTTMLIKEIDLSRMMYHAQQIKKDKLKDKKRDNKRVENGSFNFSQ